MPNVVKDEISEADTSPETSHSANCPQDDLIDSVVLGEKVGFGIVVGGLSVLNFGLLPTAFAACGAVLVGCAAKSLGRRLVCRKKHSDQIKPAPN